ncbi:MAG: hypothetical protein LBC87_04885 [Fibromonadaceae bacterium]|jgi:hypothetical protein|nr:hypothetical protein [Fibromonadaceae bacterium]
MKKIFTIFALAVMFFFCSSIMLRFTVKNLLVDNGVENKWTDIVFLDAKDLFESERGDSDKVSLRDFNEAVREKLQLNAEQKIFNSTDFNSMSNNFYSRIKKKINFYTNGFLVFNKVIVSFSNYIFSDMVLPEILPNRVIDLGDGYLVEPYPKDSIKNIDAFVQKVGYFKHILDSIGIPLVYAQYPGVICSDDEVSKNGKDFTNQTVSELMEKLSQIGLPVIDLTKECRKSFFYKTDHHWQAKTSIWAGQEISKKLNELYGFDLNVELLDTNNFSEKLVGKWLGSVGKKVIPLYEKENFYIYSPKYATDINWILFHYKLFQSSGSFDSLYHFVSDTIENSGVYSVAYPALSFSQNNNLPDGKKILLIGDSYNQPLSKFLALVFKEVNFICKRSSLLDDYLANKPDVVVLGFSKWGLIGAPETLIF